jgi:hypothetical protein
MFCSTSQVSSAPTSIVNMQSTPETVLKYWLLAGHEGGRLGRGQGAR